MGVRLKSRNLAAAALAVAAVCGGSAARAQYAGPAITTSSQSASAPASAMSAGYSEEKIAPGDIIAIYTYGMPELTTTTPVSISNIGSGGGAVSGIKVGARGEIVLPYLGVVKVSGMTAPQLAHSLEQQLKDKGILVDPQVSVELVDSPTRMVTVVGEVSKPQPVPAFGGLRLLDVISACGGFTPLASHTITIRRPGDSQPITVMLGTDPKSTDETNIPLLAGDTVIVSRVGDVYVVGQVKNPSPIPLSSNAPITVLRAISMSGGVVYSAALSKVMIIRTLADHQRVEIHLDLKKVMDGKQKDVALMSDDVLLVPRNGFKSGMAAGGAGIMGGVTNGLIYRVP